jgi:hypothetical protein
MHVGHAGLLTAGRILLPTRGRPATVGFWSTTPALLPWPAVDRWRWLAAVAGRPITFGITGALSLALLARRERPLEFGRAVAPLVIM